MAKRIRQASSDDSLRKMSAWHDIGVHTQFGRMFAVAFQVFAFIFRVCSHYCVFFACVFWLRSSSNPAGLERNKWRLLRSAIAAQHIRSQSLFRDAIPFRGYVCCMMLRLTILLCRRRICALSKRPWCSCVCSCVSHIALLKNCRKEA